MTTDLVDLLRAQRRAVLEDAGGALQRAHLRHYEEAGVQESRRRLDDLYALVIDCLLQRTLDPISSFAERISRERFQAGFDIGEVQTAFNVLEEAIWRVVLPRVPPGDLAQVAGLVGTILGGGKDALARSWVSLAAGRHVSSLNLATLFRGAGG